MSTGTTRIRRWLIEGAGVLATVSIGLILLARLLQSSWQDIFLYNGDSILLPLITESFANNESFQWVFSSQLFFFPEIPLFALSSLFATTPQAALAINACLNLLILYVALRVTGSLLSPRGVPRSTLVLSSVLCVGVFAGFVALEPVPSINGVAVATLFLLTTYYSGSILSGLAVYVLTLWFVTSSAGQRLRRGRTLTYAGIVLVVGGLAAISNPLFILHVVAPVCATAVVMLMLNRIRWSSFGVIVGVQAAVVIASVLGRKVFAEYLSADVSGYVRPEAIPASLELLGNVWRELLLSRSGTLKLSVILIIVAASAVLFVLALYWQTRPARSRVLQTSDVYIFSLVTLTVVILLLGFIITGSSTTRYLVPLFITPLLGLHVVLLRGLPWLVARMSGRVDWKRVSAIGLTVVSVGTMGAGVAFAAPKVAQITAGDNYTYADCLDHFLEGREDLNGVAQFWVSRQLELYSTPHDGEILQVKSDLSVEGWMINLSSYDDKVFSYVVVNGGILTSQDLDVLGDPKAVVACPAYTIYDFSGTPGETLLTDTIRQSVEVAREARGLGE